jgi:2-keto-4-pentenoate hydratase/2-oxohepta-3-ene-1,7-dioic acid hydratase in catechol pathway
LSTNLIRYTTSTDATPSWGVVRGGDVVPLPETITSVAEVLGDGIRIARELVADVTIATVPLEDVRPLNPVPGARIFCQGVNYPSHLSESGMDPERTFNMLFTKTTASLSGPTDDIVRPAHVRLLDYEVELGVVVGAPTSGPTTIDDDNLADFVGAFVVANDISARDVQLPEGQWFKGKSYRTFCPVGPYLCVPDPDEVGRWPELHLTLSVNGERRQDAFAGEMVFGLSATLTELASLEDLRIGDLLLTGTPGGVALQPPRAIVQRIASLVSDRKRWEIFVRMQAKRPTYLKPGDVVVASISTGDGKLQLGDQRNVVR